MSFSLSARSVESFKSEARALREDRAARGEHLSHAASLETVARTHGYRDWNTARASLPQSLTPPVQVGERVAGRYLSQPFSGVVVGLSVIDPGRYYNVQIQFDEPVDVVKFDSFSAFRSRINARIDVYGRSPEHTSDGQPHLRLDLKDRR
jgi:hypothetical protein